MKKRVLSGIRATGKLHLGNYLGAVKGMLELQNDPEFETFYMVADAHTVTTPYKIEELQINRREIILDYLAAGLDPEKSVIFQQANVPEHFELAFYFSSVVTVAKMQHLPTFKEKVKQHPENVTMALLDYPALMAADILVYKAELVPVGLDQEPHLEITREIARRFNSDYGTHFPEPQRFATKGQYIPSLTGEGKMGKSIEGSYINLTDDLETIRKKVRSIPTANDAGGEKTGGIKTLFELLRMFDENSYSRFDKEFESGSLKFVEIKDHVTEVIFAELAGFQTKRVELENNPEYVNQVIKGGTDKARTAAFETLKDVKEKMGLA